MEIILPNSKWGQYSVEIDDADLRLVIPYKWNLARYSGSRTFYALAKINGKSVLMHRLILHSSPGQFVDHIDGNGLNNKRNNIRNCTHRQNHQNERLRIDNRCGYKGVKYQEGSYIARITFDERRIYLGSYKTAKLAAEAYNCAATKFFREFASLNNLN